MEGGYDITILPRIRMSPSLTGTYTVHKRMQACISPFISLALLSLSLSLVSYIPHNKVGGNARAEATTNIGRVGIYNIDAHPRRMPRDIHISSRQQFPCFPCPVVVYIAPSRPLPVRGCPRVHQPQP